MAYRRKQGTITRAATFKEEIYRKPGDDNEAKEDSSPPSLAAQAIRASAVHRDSSLSSAYGDSAFHRDLSSYNRARSKDSDPYENTSMSPESKSGFWGVLARKAKAILDDDDGDGTRNSETSGSTRLQIPDSGSQLHKTHPSSDSARRLENPRFRKGLDAITTSLNQIGDTFEKAFVEGKTIVENKTADIIQETRRLQIRRKGGSSETQNKISGAHTTWQPLQPAQPQIQTTQETQLKASRDVAMATAAKAKLLLRELKNIKADLAFTKARCSQLEEENKMLRDTRAKGDNPADDDMIRLQLETLLAEKARLAHENSVYARENRFLREIVEYHQLTMQDVVYIDEGIEEVTEVYPISGVSRMLSLSPPISPHSPPSDSPSANPHTLTDHLSEISPLASDSLGDDKDNTQQQEAAQKLDAVFPATKESQRDSSPSG
ncbi:hypothetical protein QQ045_005718 [Rhodiola kirilowii]